jgi:hypothetical protein
MPGQTHIWILDWRLRAASTAAISVQVSPSRRGASRVAAELAFAQISIVTAWSACRTIRMITRVCTSDRRAAWHMCAGRHEL